MIYIKKAKYFIASKETPLPDVKFVPMLTRRRLSPLSKMVVYVNNGVNTDKPCKITFASQFGELSQQLKISQALVNSGSVSPAHFSLSVFNASVATSTILTQNTAGYSAIFSGKNSFNWGLKDSIAALKTSKDKERIFIFADEKIPEIYAPIYTNIYPNTSCALALLLSKESSNSYVLDENFKAQNYETAADEAVEFINQHLKDIC